MTNELMIEVPLRTDVYAYTQPFRSICLNNCKCSGPYKWEQFKQNLFGYYAEHSIQHFLGQPLGTLQETGYPEDMLINGYSWDVKTAHKHLYQKWNVAKRQDMCDYYLFAVQDFIWDQSAGQIDLDNSRLWIAGYLPLSSVQKCDLHYKGEPLREYGNKPSTVDFYCITKNAIIPFDALLPLNTSLLLDDRG